ncbi:hypothetical protein F443_18155 [Phytophthora nicotianae P1569]|uniref:No apical meristem-associated C-terminal domain-containing protein n=1 Tax=Phytophthora nicotianae P1569 TaxID=1317065 RepID=V9EAE4_PHYNI|nr:hypothetical protein F443_18155 [Phytophthora nicotianae P1569]
MVFRFTTMEDLEMLWELIRQKPFAAKARIDTGDLPKAVVAEPTVTSPLSLSLYSDSGDSSDTQRIVSGTESTISTGSSKAIQRGVKRSNAFLREIKRQEKKYKEHMDLKQRELEQGQKQFEERLEFEKKQAEDRFQFEQRIQQSNREMILESTKIFGAALAKK